MPTYVYFDRTGAGRWIWRRYDPKTKRCATVRLCGPQATLSEIWAAYEDVTADEPDNTLSGLVGAFTASPVWSGLAKTTKYDYNMCAGAILAARTRDGRAVREVPIASWTPGAVRSYMDLRATTSVSRANHELRFLRRVFAWAHERDLVPTNPAKSVKAIPERSRTRYVQDDEYLSFLQHAASNAYGYVVVIAELAYLCRLRLAEVLDLQRTDMRDDGLYSARRKGSKDAVTAWSPRLRDAVRGALSLHGRLSSVYLIPGKSGGRLIESTVQTAWQRLMASWDGERFRLHDLKRKGVSDTKDDKLTASGHRSPAMLKIYDVLPLQAKPTR